MNISGVLVRARPERFPEVIAQLQAMPGTEIHASEIAGGKIVLTIEDGAGYSVEQTMLDVHLIDGISDAALIYQFSDDHLSTPNTAVMTKEITP